ncbi:MAG: hypothetical protein L6R39_006065 [Caloplaca ligustica]|nr:MAG: hypothetical protein L6R39_006065 [Caloplaca ligustica]
MTVYYEGRGDDMNLQPFPPGFRMVSGNPKARSYNQQKLIPGSDRPIADRVSFACLDSGSSKEQPGLVSTDCKNGLRAQIHFQSCWNGKDLYKPDNSHVEYMSGLDNGVCPPTHPVALMHLFFEVLYGVNDIKKDGGKFVFSQGDTTGFGFHGDFMNGWKPDVLASAVKQCGFTNDGAVEHCAPFKPSLDPDFSKNCPERPSLLNEPVHGTIDKLAGCITITSGPQDATDADMVCAGGHTAARKGVPSLDSSVNAVSKVTTVATSSHAKASATESSASIKAIGSSHEDSDDGDDSKKIRRDVAKGDPHGSDEYGYGYDFPPTPTHHHPSPPRGSPRPQRRHNKRAMPVAEDDPYSYTFEYPPLGSPAPRRRNSKRHAS